VPPVASFGLLARLADPEPLELPASEVLSLVSRSPSGPLPPGAAADTAQLRQRLGMNGAPLPRRRWTTSRFSAGCRSRPDPSSGSTAELRTELQFQRLAVQNPSAPPELLSVILSCPVEELERCRTRARANYGSDSALDCMAEVLRDRAIPSSSAGSSTSGRRAHRALPLLPDRHAPFRPAGPAGGAHRGQKDCPSRTSWTSAGATPSWERRADGGTAGRQGGGAQAWASRQRTERDGAGARPGADGFRPYAAFRPVRAACPVWAIYSSARRCVPPCSWASSSA